MLFALHPIQSEAVDYVWARSILLAALFCFAALYLWLRGRPWAAVACFAAALLAKEECAAFPLLLAWLQWRGSLPGGPKSRAALAAMFALALAAGARVIWATTVIPGTPAGVQAGISPFQYLLAQGVVIWRYLQLVVVPYGFTVDADVSAALWLRIAAWALLVIGTLWLLRRQSRNRHLVDRRTDSSDSEFVLLPCRRSLGRPPHVPSDVLLRGSPGPAAGAHQDARGVRRYRPAYWWD